MADIYTRAAARLNQRLVPTSEGGLGQGNIVLVRYAAPTPDPEAPAPDPWTPPPAPVATRTTLKAVARGVGKELIGTEVAPGTAIVASDLRVTAAPWGGTVAPGDVLEIDSAPHTILSVQYLPAAGTVSAVIMIARC